MPRRPDADSLFTVLGNGSRRSVRDRGPMRMNPDDVERLSALAMIESANQASGETQKKKAARMSKQQKKRGRSKSTTSSAPKAKKTKRRKGP